MNPISSFAAVLVAVLLIAGCVQGPVISREKALELMRGKHPICTDAIPESLRLYDLTRETYLPEETAQEVDRGSLPSGYSNSDLAWRWTVDAGGDYIYNCQTTLTGGISQVDVLRE